MTPVVNNKEEATSILERVYPALPGEIAGEEDSDIIKLHIERYHFAGKNLCPGLVVDVACGSGYGSYLLATTYNTALSKIIAIDNDADAIAYAKTNYGHSLIKFIQGDAFNHPSDEPVNNVVSLETIEHLERPQDFINFWCSRLQPGGRFIASVPITPTMDANPFHLHDFTAASFKKMFINAGLKEIDSFIQVEGYHPGKSMKKKATGTSGSVGKRLMGFYLKNPGKFFLRIQSVLLHGFKNKCLVVLFEKNN